MERQEQGSYEAADWIGLELTKKATRAMRHSVVPTNLVDGLMTAVLIAIDYKSTVGSEPGSEDLGLLVDSLFR
jgi:hypothetical protein